MNETSPHQASRLAGQCEKEFRRLRWDLAFFRSPFRTIKCLRLDFGWSAPSWHGRTSAKTLRGWKHTITCREFGQSIPGEGSGSCRESHARSRASLHALQLRSDSQVTPNDSHN